MKWIAAASIALALAAGGIAFLRDQAANDAEAQLAALKAEAQKAQADVKAAQAERDVLRKEAAELSTAAQELRTEAEVAGRFLEAERAMNARLREDLAMASARLAAAANRQARPANALPPGLMPLQRPPIAVRAAPGGAAASAAAPAR